MHPTTNNETPEPGQGKTRLDREIEEILARSSTTRKPTPLQERPRPLRPARLQTPPAALPPRVRQALLTPVVQAFLAGLAAYVVRDASSLLAHVLALAAVSVLVLPLARGIRPAGTSPAPETRMWRGQMVDVRPRRPATPLDSLRDWWTNRKR